ncbi:hypothetical protein D3C84_867070 [compost metagenome]
MEENTPRRPFGHGEEIFTEVYFENLRTGVTQPTNRLPEMCLYFMVDTIKMLPGRISEPDSSKVRPVAMKCRGGGFRDDLIDQCAILDCAREHTSGIERMGDGSNPIAGPSPWAGLESHYTTERRWHSDRAHGVAAKCRRNDLSAYRCSRATRRASGHVFGIVRIFRLAEVAVMSGQAT